jgi:hypothetical protein
MTLQGMEEDTATTTTIMVGTITTTTMVGTTTTTIMVGTTTMVGTTIIAAEPTTPITIPTGQMTVRML